MQSNRNEGGWLAPMLPVFIVMAVVLGILLSIPESPANNGPIVSQEARVVGACTDGKYMTAMEEDQLPPDCDWVESIDHLVTDHFE